MNIHVDLRLGPKLGAAPNLAQWNGQFPTEQQFLADPHGWARLVASHLAVVNKPPLVWVLRYHLIEDLIRMPGTRQFGVEFLEQRGVAGGPLHDWWQRLALTIDGKRHQAIRTPLLKVFSFPQIRNSRARVRAIATELMDETFTTSDIDFSATYSKDLPFRVMCDFLCVPREDIPVFEEWIETISLAFGILDVNDLPQIDLAVQSAMDYFDDLVRRHLASGKEDFLTEFVRAFETESDFTRKDVIAQIVGLIFAGTDTTRTALSIMVSLLLLYRDQWDLVRNDRSLIKNAVSETLRFEPTAGSLPRFALEDLELDGHPVPANSILIMNIAAAQRDPARYKDPNRFDIRRDDLSAGTIGFGGGPHRCLGEALARAELEETLDLFLDRYPDAELTGSKPHFIAEATGVRRLSDVKLRLWP